VLLDVNASKLASPIILIDPTYPQRNALAALSNETFERFKEKCREFLKKPSIKAFEIEKKDIEKIREQAKKNKKEFVLLELDTHKQEGDIAGSKMIKFFKHLGKEISRYFTITHNGFEYNGGKSAQAYFVAESKKEIIFTGPFIEDKKSLDAFKKLHKHVFEKDKRVYAKEKIDFDIKEFVSMWKKKYSDRLKEMSIADLRILN
jgi:tRNA nucleotidyltransferase (CCA-adding enzyme)